MKSEGGMAGGGAHRAANTGGSRGMETHCENKITKGVTMLL
jgi:hypothetical protein